MESTSRKRRKVVNKCPNPLFEQWLKEWRDEAAKKGLNTQYSFHKALTSLKKYPLPLNSGKEAIILEHFGEKICSMLDSKLTKHYAENGISYPSSQGDSEELPSSETVVSLIPVKKKNEKAISKNTSNKRGYIPVPGTAPHALLVALFRQLESGDVNWMRKDDLINAAQPQCNKSFKVPDPGSYYTAWSSMATLIKKGLVQKESHPPKYQLTDSGVEIAIQLIQAGAKSDGDVVPSTSVKTNVPRLQDKTNNSQPLATVGSSRDEVGDHSSNNSCSNDVFRTTGVDNDINQQASANEFILYPGQFKIILCVDNCETTGGAPTLRRDLVEKHLKANGVPYDVRKLHVGDFLWIAQEVVHVTPGQLQVRKPKELVLDFVIERKRMDDLVSSIKDGRFHEQKFRLKSCGLKRPTYLIESFGPIDHFSLPESSIKQAISNTQVVDGFSIKKTADQTDTINYLTIVSRYLAKAYEGRILISSSFSVYHDLPLEVTEKRGMLMKFDELNNASRKNRGLTVSEVFAKMLLQLHGCTVEMAAAILELHPSVSSLITAFNNCDSQSERENVLSQIQYGKRGRTIGAPISRTLYQYFTLLTFPKLIN